MYVDFFIKRVFYLPLFLLLFLCSCASLHAPRSGVVDVPDDFFGIVHSGYRKTAEEYRLMDEMGVAWTMGTFSWNTIENKKGHFDFSSYDNFVDSTKQAGKKIVATLGYQADWLYPSGESIRKIKPYDIPHFLRYIEEIVNHYKGRMDVWNVWNEPNFGRFWYGTDKEFFELSRRTAQKIRETDPDAYIIGGAFVRAPKRYIKRMHKAGGLENLDGLAYHPYALNPAGSLRLHDKMVRICSLVNYTGDVWITEIGHPTGGKYPHRTTLEKLPSYVVKDLCGTAARGARAVLWYQLFDRYKKDDVHPKTKMESEKYFGLVYPDYERKAAAYAYELCARNIAGSVYTPDYLKREKAPSSIVSFCFLNGIADNNTLVLWNKGKRHKKVSLSLEAPATSYDITTGKGTQLSNAAALAIGRQPVIITWQGDAVPKMTKAGRK